MTCEHSPVMRTMLLQVVILLSASYWAGAAAEVLCNEGQFRCNRSRLCVPQHRICDSLADCPDGSDEWGCTDALGSRFWDHLFRKHPSAELDEQPSQCAWNDTSPCTCLDHAIICQHLGLTSPPAGLPASGLHLLDLTGNSFPVVNSELMSNVPSDTNTLVLHHAGVAMLEEGAFDRIQGLQELHLGNNHITTISEPLFIWQNQVTVLILSYNQIVNIPDNAFLNLENLRELDLRHNLLEDVQNNVFTPLIRLETLHLGENRLQTVTLFPELPALKELSLSHNKIAWIEPGAFSQLPGLELLYLSWNQLWLLQNETFSNLAQLRSLSLNGNSLRQLDVGSFWGLIQLTSLDFRSNSLQRIDSDTLRHLSKLEYVYFDDFTLCSSALHVRVCEPKGDGISSIHHLLDSFVLRTSVWVMAVLACSGNTLVLLGRLVAREPNPVHSLYIKTLALADLLMGVYLLLIAVADWRYRGVYVRHEFQWRHSPICSFCGFLSTLSCMVSVLILVVITRDRLVSVTRPLDRRQPALHRAILLVAVLWLVAAVTALLPLSPDTAQYFGEEFYSGNGVCLALHLQDPFAQGWEYSVAVFVVINTIALIFITFAYWRMLGVVRSSGLSIRSTQERHDRALAQRFVVIIATDCCCWIPVIGVKLSALCGVKVDQQLSAWLAVLVLPVNSALNPVLYTLTTSSFRNQLTRLVRSWKTRDSTPSHDSLSNAQLSLRNRTRGSQQPTRSSTLRSSWKSYQATAL